jgi:hypothetical protein
MPQFSLKRMIIATSLFAAGVGCNCYDRRGEFLFFVATRN